MSDGNCRPRATARPTPDDTVAYSNAVKNLMLCLDCFTVAQGFRSGTLVGPGRTVQGRYRFSRTGAADVRCRLGRRARGRIAWIPPGGDLAERRCSSVALRRVWAAAARERLEDALGAACGGVPPDLDIKLTVIRGEPGPALVEAADSAGDLLVVGAGRRRVLPRTWRGKVSRYCLSHARCPVLAVPHPATARELGLGSGAWGLRHRSLTLDRALRDWDPAV